MKINIQKWNQKRQEIEAQIKSLKTSIREGGERPIVVARYDGGRWIQEEKMQRFGPGRGTFEDHKRLEALKLCATGLYTLRAHLRGRQHRQKIVITHGDGRQTYKAITKEDEATLALGAAGLFAVEEPQIGT